LQKFAYRMGQFRPANPRTGLNNLLDQRQLFSGKLPTAKTQTFLLSIHAISPSLLSHSKRMAACSAKNDHSSSASSLAYPRRYGFHTRKNSQDIGLPQRYLANIHTKTDTLKKYMPVINRFLGYRKRAAS